MKMKDSTARRAALGRALTFALVLIVSSGGLLGGLSKQAAAEQVGRWDRFEVSVTNEKQYRDPYRDVTLQAVFTRPGGETVRFWGFHDGGTTWKLRFMPDRPGTWSYRAKFSDGSGEVDGTFECIASDLPGLISRYEKNPIWFGFQGGEAVLVRSFHVGDRFFAENWDHGERTAFLDWAGEQGYNMLSIGSLMLNRRQPERGGPWRTPDLWDDKNARPRPAEYHKLEVHLDDLSRRRILVFPFAGFFGQAANFPTDHGDQELYLRYSLARLGTYWNLTFNVAGPEPLVKPRLFQDAMRKDDINRLGAQIARMNPLGHLVTIHNGGGDDPFQKEDWNGIITLQGSKNVDWKGIHRFLMKNQTGDKPVFAQEVHWPGNVHNHSYTLDEIRQKAWVLLFGAATINFGDMAGRSSTGFTGSMNLDDRNQAWHDAVKIAWDGFERLPWQTAKPAPQLVDNGFCLADDRNYLVYLPEGGSVTVRAKPGTYSVTWIRGANPAEKKEGIAVPHGHTLPAPDTGDWVLHLSPLPTR